jgi:hypothetical protein
MSEFSRQDLWLGVLLWFGFLGAVAYGVHRGLDHLGYISHAVVTDITVSSNWLVGETKRCSSPVLLGRDATQANKPNGYAMVVVVCDDSPVKTFTVTFYGRTEQPEYSGVQWSCLGESGSFTCKQTGGTDYRGW